MSDSRITTVDDARTRETGRKREREKEKRKAKRP